MEYFEEVKEKHNGQVPEEIPQKVSEIRIYKLSGEQRIWRHAAFLYASHLRLVHTCASDCMSVLRCVSSSLRMTRQRNDTMGYVSPNHLYIYILQHSLCWESRVAQNKRSMCPFIAGGFDSGRGRVQHCPFADISRSSCAVHSTNRGCTSGRAIALLATCFLAFDPRSLSALSLCTREWGGQSVCRRKRRLLGGANARVRERCGCLGADGLAPGVGMECIQCQDCAVR